MSSNVKHIPVTHIRLTESALYVTCQALFCFLHDAQATIMP